MKNKILIAIAIISTLSAIYFANRKQEVIVHFSKPVQPVGNNITSSIDPWKSKY